MEHIAPSQETGSLPQFAHYDLRQQIGEGGYGYVYEAKQISTGQKVAIKVLKLDPSLSEQQKKYQSARFERETRLCAELNHPHIVKLLDKGYTPDNKLFAVFEFIDGETLKERILRNGGLSAKETGDLMGQVLDALAAAHAKGIVHRDLKPRNIMVTEVGSKSHVKILDFGIGAFTREFRNPNEQSLTLTREVMGTPAYSPPELLRGEPATLKSDLYAWGLTTIECLTGVPVMKGNSVAEVFQQQLAQANVPLPPGIAGHPLADLLRRVLHKNPRKRTGDAKAFYQDFKKLNLNSLVGQIESPQKPTQNYEMDTAASPLNWKGLRSEKRQITVLNVKLTVVTSEPTQLDLETLDAIQKDQLNLCKDVGARFGGHVAGELADNVSLFFGYPQVSDNDARRAGRAALELMGTVRRRSALLQAEHGIQLEIRMGMHAGSVLSKPNQTPQGLVPNVAFNLLYAAPAGAILVSESARKLLDPYLEFEAAPQQMDTHFTLPNQYFALVGERQTEALSFLRPWSANREMIGREPERKTVLNHWQEVQKGLGTAVVLHGQAGIGKSKLVYEVKKEVRSQNHLYRECRCLPEHQNNALYPFLEMLRNHWGIKEMRDSAQIVPVLEAALSDAGVDLQSALPILCAWLSVELSEGYEVSQATPDVQKQILFDLLKASLRHVGSDQPCLIVLEDLHWLDPTGQEFVEFLLKEMDSQPYLLLMTTRPAFVPEWKAERLQDVQLEPLDAIATEQLVAGVLDGKSVEEQALKYISERADGIPLYLEELTRMLVEEGYLEEVEDQFQLVADSDAQDIPMTLQDLLNARLDRLGPVKETAQLAATIGREFNYDLLARTSLRDESSVQVDLEILMDADLVYRQRRVNDESYVFRHALIRDAAYEGMLVAGRKAHHGRVAEVLKTDFPEVVEENPFEVGRHLAGAEEFGEAVGFGVRGIEKNVRLSTFKEAQSSLPIIRKWVDKIEDTLARVVKSISLSACNSTIAYSVNGPGSQEAYDIGMEIKSQFEHLNSMENYTSDPALREKELRNDWSIFMFHTGQGNLEESAKYGLELCEKAKQFGHHKIEMAVSSGLTQTFCLRSEFEKAKEFGWNVINKYDAKRDNLIYQEFGSEPFVFAASMLAYIECDEGNPLKGIELVNQSIEVAKQSENPSNMLWAYTFATNYLSLLGEKELCRSYMEEFLKGVGDDIHEHFISILLFIIRDWCNNDLEVAQKNREILLQTGMEGVLSYYEIPMTDALIQLKKYDEAVELIQASIEGQLRSNIKSKLPQSYDMLAWALFHQKGKITEEVKTAYQKSIELAEASHFTFPIFCAGLHFSEMLWQTNQLKEAKIMLLGLAPLIEDVQGKKQLQIYHIYQKQLNKVVDVD